MRQSLCRQIGPSCKFVWFRFQKIGRNVKTIEERIQRMMKLCSTVGLVIGSSLWIVISAVQDVTDTEVSCVFMESCILPCSFQGDTDVVIDWTQETAGDRPVHSYYDNQDQLKHQDQRFRGRTSLFKDQISRGNASLLLTGVKVQDQGRYRCYTGSERGRTESFIILKVEAPVGKVKLQQVENRITCSSEGIYPEPELTWSTRPPSSVTFKNNTEVQRTEQLLYNISSSLILSHSDSDLSYICTISTDRNSRRATLFKPTSISGLYTETKIPCTSSTTSFKSLIWRFDHSQIILTQTRADDPPTVSEGWRQQVKGVSESGSLMLQHLSPSHEGTYTCELRDAEETLITNTFLRIEEGPGNSIGAFKGGVVVGAILVVTAVFFLVRCCRQKKEHLSGPNTKRKERKRKSKTEDAYTEMEQNSWIREEYQMRKMEKPFRL